MDFPRGAHPGFSVVIWLLLTAFTLFFINRVSGSNPHHTPEAIAPNASTLKIGANIEINFTVITGINIRVSNPMKAAAEDKVIHIMLAVTQDGFSVLAP